jgi:cation diffusion facilitator family transporter
MQNSGYKMVKQVSWLSIVINLFLSVFKLIAGIVARSNAMISDAVHSASDVFTTFVVLIGVKVASKEADDDHPFGHERLESIAGIILSVILGGTGLLSGYAGIKKIMLGMEGSLESPGLLALIAAVVSIVVKEAMFWYTKGIAKKVSSTALMADAWHHRSDALSSVGSLIGIGGAMLGFAIMDPIASLVICLFILSAAFTIMRDATNQLVDKGCDEDTIHQIEEVIINVEGVILIDSIRSRIFGNKIYLEVEIGCKSNLTLMQSHSIAEEVHEQIEHKFPNVKHIHVHVNPHEIEQ